MDSIPKNWKETILKMMEKGASKQEVKAELGISNKLFTRFMDEEPEFGETIKKGGAIFESLVGAGGPSQSPKPQIQRHPLVHEHEEPLRVERQTRTQFRS